MTESKKTFSPKALIFPALIIALTLWVFAKPLFSGETLWSMDNAPMYPTDYQAMSAEAMTGAWRSHGLGESQLGLPLHHSRLLAVVLPPFVFRVASYMLNVLLLIGACYYFLRGRGFSGVTAILPAIAMAYSGYMFTLISAGHFGMFDMYPYAVLAFGLVDRAIVRRSWWHFAAVGLCVGFGIGAQPDVQFLYGCLLVAFAIYVAVTHWPKKEVGKAITKLGLGAIFAGIFFAGTSLTLFGNLYGVYIPARNALRGDTTESKWEYSTNWSMPPEDIVEFVAPNIFGRETTDRESPYWGRLGRSMNWSPETRQGFMNYRQHNVYLGAIQILFSFYAFSYLFRRKKDKAASGGIRKDTIFWSGAFFVTVLLALGRYTPFYKLFWMLPAAGRIRCPVKFIHLTELAVAVLFATGLTLFLRDLAKTAASDDPKQTGKPLFITAIVSAVVGVLFMVIGPMIAASGDLAQYWQSIGMGPLAETFQKNMSGGMAHAALLFFIGAVVFFFASKFAKASWCKPTVVAIVCATVLLDLGITTRPFVRVKDVSRIYEPNFVAEMLTSDAVPARTAYFLSQRMKMDPLFTSFMINGVDIVDLRQYAPPGEDEKAFFNAFAKSPVRLWQITNTRYIVGHLQQLNQLIANPAFSVKTYFNATQDGQVIPAEQANAKQAVVEFQGALPRAQVYHAWKQLVPDAALKAMTEPTWDPRAIALVSGEVAARESDRTASPVNITKYARKHIVIEVDVPEEGLLVLNDRYNPDWKVTVNGKSAAVLQTNYIMRGTPVPAGKSTVEMHFAPFKNQFIISILFTIALIVWGVLTHLPRKGTTPNSTAASDTEAAA